MFAGLLARSEAPSLAHFVRSLVGMDRVAAQEAFSGFLSDRSLTPPQIRFIEMVIDQLIEGIFDKLKAVHANVDREDSVRREA